MSNIFFLSYNEANALAHYEMLSKHCAPIHIAGISGIFEAHRACAEKSESDWFFVVDADSVLLPLKDGKYFDFVAPSNLSEENVYVWDTLNPVNGLVYGYGGIKLFHKNRFVQKNISYIDMTSTVATIKETKKCISETRFNSSPFDAWKAGFRETCKLTAHYLNMPDTPDKKPWKKLARDKIDIWTSVGHDKEFGSFCIQGAKLGEQYAKQYDKITAVNNYYWLKSYFQYHNKGLDVAQY
jgi:hypothetical protein